MRVGAYQQGQRRIEATGPNGACENVAFPEGDRNLSVQFCCMLTLATTDTSLQRVENTSERESLVA